MPDTIIRSIREWVSSCPYLYELANVDDISIDWLEENPKDCGIFPGGQTLLREYMDGEKRWQYMASIMIYDFSLEDAARLEGSGFMERFHHWLNGFSRTGFPLPAGCDFYSVSAGNGFMDAISEDGQKGRYRIDINLTYERMI